MSVNIYARRKLGLPDGATENQQPIQSATRVSGSALAAGLTKHEAIREEP